MEIKKINEVDKKLVEIFLKNENAMIQHTPEWCAVVEETYKNTKKEIYVLLKNNEISAIFPFIMVRSRIFGNRMISIPFLDVGGFLGEYGEGDIKHLIELIGKNKGIKHIEIRLNDFMENFETDRKYLTNLGFSEDSSKKQMIVSLTNSEDFWKRFHKHTRNEIRKAESYGLSLVKIGDIAEIKKFYRLYEKEMKNFGSPQHSFKFFMNLFQIMNDKAIGFNCYHGKKMVASIVLFHENKSAYVAFNVSDARCRNMKPNDLLYWAAIKWCMGHNLKSLDLGQIGVVDEKDTRAYGLYKFKSKWLGNIYQRSYFYLSSKQKDSKKTAISKEKYKRFRKLWKILPIFVARILGPSICSQLGI